MQIVPRKKQQAGNAVTLRDAMNQIFDESFWDPWKLWDTTLPALQGGSSQQFFQPNFNISEDEKEILITADVPGYDAKDIEITLDDNVLTLQGKMQSETEEKDKKKKWYRKECCSGSFYQSFTLPTYAAAEDIKCKAKNGKLTVSVPKKQLPEKPAGKKLPIDVG